MTTINLQSGPTAIAVACGTILTSLIDTLVEKGLLSNGEIRDILANAMINLEPRSETRTSPDLIGALDIVKDLLMQFPESGV